jgi:neutral ceramidase
MSIIQAGVSRQIITPPSGIHLMGYGNRIQGNIGVHDDLYVTTVVLETDDTRVALLTVDHTFINRVFVEKIKNRVHDLCNIDPDAIFVCCSHTHGGPIGYADEHSRLEDIQYMDFLVDKLVESTVNAAAELQPVHLQAGKDSAHININRRERTPDGQIIIGNNPDGLVDSSVQVMQVVSEQNMTLATLVNYACHAVVMGPLNRKVTADWVGAMRQKVEETVGGLCLFFQGATANLNPRKMRWAVDSWDEVEEQGVEVADAVSRACDQATPLNSDPINIHQAVCWLPLMPPHGYNEQVREFMPPGVETDEEIRSAIRTSFPWHTEIENRQDGLYSPIYIGALRIGDWRLMTLATEPFVEIGLAIKAASPAKMTFVAGYSNGCNSYLPVRSVYEEGGYEVETAALFYGLPSGFVVGGAETVLEMAVGLLS